MQDLRLDDGRPKTQKAKLDGFAFCGVARRGVRSVAGIDEQRFVARAVALLAPEMEVDRYPAADMIWLDVRLEGIPERAAYRRAVAGLLLDDDPLLRSRALQFFHTLPAVPEAEALFAIGNDRVGYAGVQSPSAPVGVTLEDRPGGTTWRVG